MLGFNTDKVVQGEIDSGGLNRRGKMSEWDWGDDFRAGVYSLFGKDYGRENLERLARAKQTENYNDQVSGLNIKLDQYRPGTKITRQQGETLQDMQARGNLELALGKEIAAAKITNPQADLSGVKTIQDLQAVIGADNQRQRDEDEQERFDDKNEESRRYYADRADARAAQNRQYELQIMQLQQADRLKAQERKDRMFMTLMAGLQNLGQGFTI